MIILLSFFYLNVQFLLKTKIALKTIVRYVTFSIIRRKFQK